MARAPLACERSLVYLHLLPSWPVQACLYLVILVCLTSCLSATFLPVKVPRMNVYACAVPSPFHPLMNFTRLPHFSVSIIEKLRGARVQHEATCSYHSVCIVWTLHSVCEWVSVCACEVVTWQPSSMLWHRWLSPINTLEDVQCTQRLGVSI